MHLCLIDTYGYDLQVEYLINAVGMVYVSGIQGSVTVTHHLTTQLAVLIASLDGLDILTAMFLKYQQHHQCMDITHL